MATDAQKTFLIILFFISLVTHALFFLYFFYPNPCLLNFDSAHYQDMALALKNNFCFCTAQGTPFFYRVPGYPIFLAGIYSIFGTNPYYIVWIQIGLASFMPVLVFFLGKKIFHQNKGARYAALMTAIHPAFFIFPCLIMTETLFVFVFTFFLCMFIYSLETSFKPTIPFLTGILLGIISLIRPLGLPLVFASIFLTYLYPGLSFFCRFLKSFMLFFGWGLVVSVWFLRNFLLTGCLFLHTFSGPHLLNHGATRIIMETQNISYEKAKYFVQQTLEFIQKESEVTRSHLQEKYALDIFMHYPSTTIKFFIKNSIKTTISLYSAELLFVDSGGKLPSYDTKRTYADMIKRFLFPIVHNRAIPFVIYYELVYMLFLFVGFVLFLVQGVASFIPPSTLLRTGIRLPDHTEQDAKHRVECVRANGFWPPMFMLTFIALFIGMSCICGFARLRLPIEPLLIIGSATLYSRITNRLSSS